MNRYIESNNSGIIALVKRNGIYEYNAMDSSYCVIYEYEKDIKNGEYFKWIENTKLDYSLMVKDFNEIVETESNDKIRKYLIWEKPNILIDFDSKYLANHYHDRAFEDMVPKDWKGKYLGKYEEFLKHIPGDLKYWTNAETLIEYLNRFLTVQLIEDELELIDKAINFTNLDSYEERWNKFERELLGNIQESKDYGWLSKVNYVPNIVMNRETKRLFLAYLNDQIFKPNCEIELSQISNLLNNEITKISKEKTDNNGYNDHISLRTL